MDTHDNERVSRHLPGSLHDCLSWLQLAGLLCMFDDGDGESVLDGGERVEIFEFSVHLDIGGGELNKQTGEEKEESERGRTRG